MKEIIDLRSDTVTKPSMAMRKVMAAAEVGDDVYGEDPTVNLLQEKIAALLGKESALFVTSGCMSNQLAIKSHTDPGDEIICENDAHIFNYETAAPSIMSSVQVKTIPGVLGVIKAQQLAEAVRPDAYYMPRSRLVCLENTHNRAGGTVYPIEEIITINSFAREKNLLLHLDGARLWNASVASGIPLKEYAQYFDSVSVCFSKGLGAPVGSCLTGSAEFIKKAHKWRKVFGGGMRQSGILAAGALFAVETNIDRLKEDHEKIRTFTGIVKECKGFFIDLDSVQTNIVIINIEKTGKTAEEIIYHLRSHGVLISAGKHNSIRAVAHLDVSMNAVIKAAEIIKEQFS